VNEEAMAQWGLLRQKQTNKHPVPDYDRMELPKHIVEE